MLPIALDIENSSQLENYPFTMFRRKETFCMLKLELKPMVWHQKDLCILNIALGIETFSSRQPSWTPSWKWPFSNVQKKRDF